VMMLLNVWWRDAGCILKCVLKCVIKWFLKESLN
jgi:hypothetical protein